MKKETFDVLDEYASLVASLSFELEKQGLDLEVINELLEPFDEYHSKVLKLGKFSEEDKAINKQAMLIEKYENLPRYLKLCVIYEYDNGMSLCETTAGGIHLIPKEYIGEIS